MFDEIRLRAIFVTLLVLCTIIIWPFHTVIGAGIVLAYVCERPYYFLLDKSRKKGYKFQLFFATLVVLLVYAIFFVPMTIILYKALTQIVDLISDNRESLTYGQVAKLIRGYATQAIEWTGLKLDLNQVMANLNKTSLELGQKLLGKIGDGLQATPEFLFESFILLLVEGGATRFCRSSSHGNANGKSFQTPQVKCCAA